MLSDEARAGEKNAFQKGALAQARSFEQKIALEQRLRDEDEDELADKLAECGQPMELTCGCCQKRKMVTTHCKRKWCPICARMIAARRTARYEAAVNSMQWPIFATWTVENTPELDISVIRWLRRGFGKLRQQDWWKKQVMGGVATVEITNIGNGWHPHLHSIIDCRWLAIKTAPPGPFDRKKAFRAKCENAGKEVAARWARTLKVPEARIDVKRAYTERTGVEIPYGSESIAREVLKYSVKSSDLVECKEPIGELIRTLEMCRLVTSWGSCYGKKLKVPDELREPPACESCGAHRTMIPSDVLHRIHESAIRERDRSKNRR